jgi:hypothetical protein
MLKIAAATALVALTSPAQAAHTWYFVNFASAKCILSPSTPEQWARIWSAPPIPPDNVVKSKDGNLSVWVDFKDGAGEERTAFFFTSKSRCDAIAAGLKPKQAPSDDIN